MSLNAQRPSSRQQRLVAMAEHVLQSGAVPMQELAERFAVARMTVYRDVAELESAGVVFLKQGMAVAAASSFTETSNAFRSALNTEWKRAMCREARGRIRTGSTVFLDDSSTVLPLVEMLAERAPMTVITHSQAVAAEVARFPELRLFVAGGSYRPTYESYAGQTTVATLRSLSADFCVMSTTAIEKGVLFHPVEENVAVKRAMIERSRMNMLLADSSKFGHRATHEVCTADAFDLVVVSGPVPEAELARLTPEVVTT